MDIIEVEVKNSRLGNVVALTTLVFAVIACSIMVMYPG